MCACVRILYVRGREARLCTSTPRSAPHRHAPRPPPHSRNGRLLTHTCPQIDSSGISRALECDDHEALLVGAWVRTGSWLQPEVMERLEVSFLDPDDPTLSGNENSIIISSSSGNGGAKKEEVPWVSCTNTVDFGEVSDGGTLYPSDWLPLEEVGLTIKLKGGKVGVHAS